MKTIPRNNWCNIISLECRVVDVTSGSASDYKVKGAEAVQNLWQQGVWGAVPPEAVSNNKYKDNFTGYRDHINKK